MGLLGIRLPVNNPYGRCRVYAVAVKEASISVVQRLAVNHPGVTPNKDTTVLDRKEYRCPVGRFEWHFKDAWPQPLGPACYRSVPMLSCASNGGVRFSLQVRRRTSAGFRPINQFVFH